MGAYLSEPVTEKFSINDQSDYIDVGASSMQGWRMSQEDAHNCIISFDENVSLFAVYDGHGGAEVATYCAEKLPEFLKNLQAYKDGNYEQALKDAFLGFDEVLLQEDVIEILKRLAGEKNPDRESELAEEEEEEDLAELCQEGCLPLDQVLEKYKGAAAQFQQNHNKPKCDEAVASSSGTSKRSNLTQFSKGKCNSLSDGPSGSHQASAKTENEQRQNVEKDDIVVSSSSAKHENSILVNYADDHDESNENIKSASPSILGNSADDPDEADENSIKSASPSKLVNHTNEAEDVKKIVGKSGSPLILVNCTDEPDENIGKSASSSSSSSNLKENGGVLKCISPDSSSANAKDTTFSKNSSEKVKNGDIASYGESSSGSKNEGVSSTSSVPVNLNITSSEIKDALPKKKTLACHNMDDDDSSSEEEDDADFHAEESSGTEDGEEDCEPCDEETEEENDDEEGEEDEEGEAMLDDDDAFCANMIEEPGKDSGCTAVVALLHGRDLYVANAGDSRCVLCRGGEAIEMSLDHKPEDVQERYRIYKAGGKVTMDGRVNGGLNLSRAIGDHAYKMNKDLPPEEQMISALPDIKKIAITKEDEFMILACDGIWNFMSSEEVVEFIKKRLDEGRETVSQICEELFDNCLAPHTIGDGTGCDNMTAVIVRFKQPKVIELSTKLSDKLEAETVTVTSSLLKKKRTALQSQDNDNEDSNNENNTNCKRFKTDNEYKSKNDLTTSLQQTSTTATDNDDANIIVDPNVSTTTNASTKSSTNAADTSATQNNEHDSDQQMSSTVT